MFNEQIMNEQWEMQYLPSHINTCATVWVFFSAKAASFVLWFVFNLFIFIFAVLGLRCFARVFL